jgi:methyl-accepting chemotaxis protein
VRIEVHHYFHDVASPSLVRAVESILAKVTSIMTTQAELAAGIAEITETVKRIKTESTTTLQKVTDLETALANAGNVTPEVQQAFDDLKAQVKAVDDLVPDAPTA